MHSQMLLGNDLAAKCYSVREYSAKGVSQMSEIKHLISKEQMRIDLFDVTFVSISCFPLMRYEIGHLLCVYWYHEHMKPELLS